MGDTAISLILQAGAVVKGVLAVLLFFSIFSWAIIIYKFSFIRKVQKESDVFYKAFRRSKNPDALQQTTKSLLLSPVANIFRSLYAEPGGISRDEMRRFLRRLEGLEGARLERYLTFLATTGTTTPFIGLFGTVWGIMNAFRGIGRMGSASLAVVAPGIAEALITTAAGLAAAIPAVIAYNYYLSRARRITVEMEEFSEELVDYMLSYKGHNTGV